MTYFNRPILFACSVISTSLLVPGAHAQTNRARLITDSLEKIDGDILMLNESGITLETKQGTQDYRWSESFGMSIMMPSNQKQLIRKINDTNMLAFVETTDGQRLFLTLLDSEDPDTLLGSMGPNRVSVSLEHIQSVWRQRQYENRYPLKRTHTNEESDRVKLINGDELLGFVVSIGSQVLIETDTGEVSVPLNQTTSVELANPESTRQHPGLYLHTYHGLVFHTNRFSVDPETAELSLTLRAGLVQYTPDSDPILDNSGSRWPGFDLRLSNIEVRHSDLWISDPLTAGIVSFAPTGDRQWTPEPYAYNLTINTLDAGSIKLNAPTRLVTEVEPGSSRLYCQVAPRPGDWNNHIASIHAIDSTGEATTIWMKELTGKDQPIDVDVKIPNSTTHLAFSVDPGRSGPIQDACEFRMIRVLVTDESQKPG